MSEVRQHLDNIEVWLLRETRTTPLEIFRVPTRHVLEDTLH